MSDFISMQCPSCGGSLAVGANALSLRCEHCGSEHMIRREAGEVILESYARCPVCNRNDRAEKVTAILRSQTHNTQGVTYQNQTRTAAGKNAAPVNQLVAVPVQTSQKSELAAYLIPPQMPKIMPQSMVKDGVSHLALASAIVLVGISIVTLLGCGGVALIPICLSALLFIFAVPRENKANRVKRPAAEERRRELQLMEEEGTNKWNLAMERWNKLYYCGRDDCVFLPGSGSSAPITSMTEYLFR